MNERERLLKIIESEKLTARQFAAEIGVSAGTISNILGGRNNASLEIMTKILNRFRTISTDWLVLGTGTMYRPNGGIVQTALFGDMKPLDIEPNADVTDELPVVASSPANPVSQQQVAKQVAKIVVFYTDGTFEER